jgi:DNA-binding CsgD family transcriptional regulator
MTVDARSETVLPGPVAARIHALWDELADFGAHETDAALVHAMRVLSDLAGVRRAFWLGAVRLGTKRDPMAGWRIRGIRQMDPTPEGERVYKLSRQRLDGGTTDAVTLAQVREAGVFRARLLRELAAPGFFATADYDLLYRSRNVRDAIFIACPVNEDAESYFGWYRIGEQASPFAPYDRDLLAYALRPLKWFHRRVMLHHGLLIARAPLTPMERRLVNLLLTERVEKEIAQELALTPATTHTYITDLFRKFGVSGRSGLTALWLGKSPA